MLHTDHLQASAVRRVDHVSFRVDDLDRALAFYGELLGCHQIPRPDFGFRGAWLEAGDVQVHLIETAVDERTGTPPTQATPMANHVAFGVDDADSFRARLEAVGFPTMTIEQAVAQFWVQDPFGNVVEFIAR